MPDLAKTRTVLTIHLGKGAPTFCQEVGSGDKLADLRRHEVTLDRDVWIDMGRPSVITVTIEPGDKLNEPEVIPIPTFENPDLVVTV